MSKQNVFKAVGRAYDAALNLNEKINADFKTKPFSIHDIIARYADEDGFYTSHLYGAKFPKKHRVANLLGLLVIQGELVEVAKGIYKSLRK